ncbi:hypothetical protein TWF788_001938 [Orbilia oligospora]|uniref:Uncharacterized protein n=1 Tax=Orbilia oligospora TaxID=2813651 RepID=A0A6G1MFB2_ORBOL|nr:hypothetical protein TWF788_001938 [Orbilia oligospora]KAF3198400.1 hypothetical protein TWF679_002069 [Orbilia oligospora]KAF3205628.1 hypothetical protein TWF191_001793 [Orbilia oligospora]KAF3256519.1 hypothetical protein TWF192_001943 [Orbilia oligospora]
MWAELEEGSDIRRSRPPLLDTKIQQGQFSGLSSYMQARRLAFSRENACSMQPGLGVGVFNRSDRGEIAAFPDSAEGPKNRIHRIYMPILTRATLRKTLIAVL